MEKFFIKSFTVSEVTEELLLRRYNNIEYIMRKEIEDGYDFIKVAYEADKEEKIWQLWANLYPNMTKENYISFEEFKSTIIPSGEVEIENLDTEEILSRVNNIINLTLKEVDGNGN